MPRDALQKVSKGYIANQYLSLASLQIGKMHGQNTVIWKGCIAWGGVYSNIHDALLPWVTVVCPCRECELLQRDHASDGWARSGIGSLQLLENTLDSRVRMVFQERNTQKRIKDQTCKRSDFHGIACCWLLWKCSAQGLKHEFYSVGPSIAIPGRTTIHEDRYFRADATIHTTRHVI